MDRIKELETLIKKHQALYDNGNPEITDTEFDSLKKELETLDKNNPVLYCIGSNILSENKISHIIVMGSLNKITYIKNNCGDVIGDGLDLVDEWYDEHPEQTVWSHKIDGLAGELVYINGQLTQASTRGNGYVGQNITKNVKMIKDCPQNLDNLYSKFKNFYVPETVIQIRGEFYIPKKFFEENLAGTMANARNAVAGSIQAEPEVTAQRGVQFIAYKLIINGLECGSMQDSANIVNNLCADSPKLRFVTLNKGKLTKEIIDYQNSIRKDLEYDTDGLVVMIDNTIEKEKYGYVGKCPKGAFAFKFLAEQVETEIISITNQVGRTGKLTPVAELKPVRLAGSMVSRCTLHNYAEIKRLGIGIGDTVLLEKAGDIIPHIIRVTKQNSSCPAIIPLICPKCACPTEFDNVNVWCRNVSCSSVKNERLEHFIKTLDIKEIGPMTIEKITENINNFSLDNLFTLTEDDLSFLGDKIASNIISSINSKRKVPFDLFLAAVGIPNVGLGTAKVLAKHFISLDKFLKTNLEELTKIQGIGTITCQTIIKACLEDSNEKKLLENLGNIMEITPFEVKLGKFSGMKFCCTGELSMKRNDVKRIITDNGGEYTSISKGLCYLLIGEGAVPAKIEKAQKLGAKVITEDEFFNL